MTVNEVVKQKASPPRGLDENRFGVELDYCVVLAGPDVVSAGVGVPAMKKL